MEAVALIWIAALGFALAGSPAVTEPCNSADDDGDELIDEPVPGESPNFCVPFTLDADLDEYGADSGDGLCVCPAFYLDDANRGGCAPNAVHEAVISPPPILWDGQCWSALDDDCADDDATIHPRTPGDPPDAAIDGVDGDCVGRLTVLELDCDDDGQYARPPVVPDGPFTPTGIGLEHCQGLNPVTLDCFGTALTLTCDPNGFWAVSTDDLEALGVFAQGHRIGQSEDCDPGGWDCDDLCPARCEGLDEVCDGVDNDCDGAAGADADENGVPDAMQADTVDPGTVHEHEGDSDGDGRIWCDSPAQPQGTTAPSTCDPLTVAGLPSDNPDVGDEASPSECGCASGQQTGGAAAWTLLLWLVRRRRDVSG